MIAIGSRVVGLELAKMIIEGWLETEFEGGRFQRRIDQISEMEN
jgi:ribose 5-phosphate isomerase B